MTCPSCGAELGPGNERCPGCDPAPPVRTEGALAPNPRLVTPPRRPEPSREGPARRDARERPWREEVRERVRSRRQKRADAGLPLFDLSDPVIPPRPPRPAAQPAAELPSARSRSAESASQRPPLRQTEGVREPEPEIASSELSEAELADLPLRPAVPEAGPTARTAPEILVPSLDEGLLAPAEDVEVGLEPPLAEPLPVERPARPGERARAAAIDAGLFALVCAIVVYFTSRAAHVGVGAVFGAWPWLFAYFGLLAGFYAGYFGGTTGQTPGKLALGLRVVGPGGGPPGHVRASVRGLAGVLGVALFGVGLAPMAIDPATRALHDRLFRTRVVRG